MSRAEDFIKQGQYLFSKKRVLDGLFQEQADHFYPERADFTNARSLGADFASDLSTSVPLLARRELASSIAGMLRPKGEQWYDIGLSYEENLDHAGRGWMQDKTKLMYRAMYDKSAQFIRATKEADNDFVTFGNAVISVELNRLRNGLLYTCYHLRDVCWKEGIDGAVDNIYRRWKPTAMDMISTFNIENVDKKVAECYTDSSKDSNKQFNCMHCIVPIDMYNSINGGKETFQTPYVSLHIDVDNKVIMEEEGLEYPFYSVPRWQTVAGSQYAFSPCTVASLPDARLIQAMTLTLLEAGEKAVNPPMIATADTVKSDISIFAGGVTWVDQEYDERLGQSIRPIPQDYSSLPYGMDMRDGIKETIMEAFYLNKLNLPPASNGDMTAYETSQRVQEYIRNALPLFEPMETDYNGSICENTFGILMREGAFGNVNDMPESIRGEDIAFKFKSPLHDAMEKQKGVTFLEAKAMLAEAVAIDPSTSNMVDARIALRDVLEGTTPTSWLRSDEDLSAMDEANAQKQEQAEMLALMQQGGETAKVIGEAKQLIDV